MTHGDFGILMDSDSFVTMTFKWQRGMQNRRDRTEISWKFPRSRDELVKSVNIRDQLTPAISSSMRTGWKLKKNGPFGDG